MHLGRVGVDSGFPFEDFDGPVDPFAQVGLGLALADVGIELTGAFEVGQGLFVVLRVAQKGQALEEPSPGVVGLQGQHLTVELHRFRDAALVLVFQAFLQKGGGLAHRSEIPSSQGGFPPPRPPGPAIRPAYVVGLSPTAGRLRCSSSADGH